MQTENGLPKSCKFQIKIRANPGLAQPGFEQHGPGYLIISCALWGGNLMSAVVIGVGHLTSYRRGSGNLPRSHSQARSQNESMVKISVHESS